MKVSTKYLRFLCKSIDAKRAKHRHNKRTVTHMKNYGKLTQIEGCIIFADDPRDKQALEQQLQKHYNKFTKTK